MGIMDLQVRLGVYVLVGGPPLSIINSSHLERVAASAKQLRDTGCVSVCVCVCVCPLTGKQDLAGPKAALDRVSPRPTPSPVPN